MAEDILWFCSYGFESQLSQKQLVNADTPRHPEGATRRLPSQDEMPGADQSLPPTDIVTVAVYLPVPIHTLLRAPFLISWNF